jgi:hypothetical protein
MAQSTISYYTVFFPLVNLIVFPSFFGKNLAIPILFGYDRVCKIVSLETKEKNKKAFEERFDSMYTYFKGSPKWSYTLEERFDAVMKEATSKGYELDKCNEMLAIFEALEKDSLPTFTTSDYLQSG